ncbi:hypothetical protein ACLHDG_06745 [Sulfurovum sp. CS9]|uniref:hypothetical protein n=1 Tax=Sulfurovum sp. CS9 TaxID=3391146 RepID=UPI0039E8E0E1
MNYRATDNKQPLSAQIKPLNEKVQRYIRCIKRLDQAYSVTPKTELAEVTGVSRRYLQRNSEKIEAYYRTAPPPSDNNLTWYYNRSIDYYLKGTQNARTALGAIVGYLLKYRYGQLGHLQKATAIKASGCDIVKLTVAIKSRKHSAKGTPIQAHSKAVKNMSYHNKIAWIDKLFIRKGGYYAGHTSKLWKTTKLMDDILAEAVTVLFDKISNEKVNFAHLGNGLICRTNMVTYSSKCARIIATLQDTLNKSTYHWYLKPLILPFKQVQQLCLSSMLHIITNSIGFENGNFIVSLNHHSPTNPTLGRSYNVFTRLRSFERKVLGYLNYDMSCALQTISLQLIQATEDDYPLLTRYSKDISFKRALREDISTSLNIPIADVKAKLTAFANGGVSGIDKHHSYRKFQEESDRLRRKVLAHTAKHNPQILQQSQAQSKKKLPEDIDWFSVNAEDSQALARGKASVYFFVWTYYERLIRKAMLTVLTDGIEVHDAVYSKMDVSTNVIEATIFESTGFKIIIDKEI